MPFPTHYELNKDMKWPVSKYLIYIHSVWLFVQYRNIGGGLLNLFQLYLIDVVDRISDIWV